MSLAIAGMGWVTPLGSGVDSVWERLLHGHEALPTTISEKFSDRAYNVFRVPEATMEGFGHPRLRRASVISRFAAAAGLDALRTADVKLDPQNAERTALIFAISNGGVIYTKRFYRDVVDAGAQSASPLLFPETVFNAPASHLAAILGVTGATYTLVGEGAGAIVLARDGPFTIECAHPGGYFAKRAEAGEILKRILRDLSRSEVDLVIASANGTFVDQAEYRALKAVVSNAFVYTAKPALGESVGAAGLWQVILAAQALRSAELPPVLHADPAIALQLSLSRKPLVEARRAIVLSCGVNQQAAGLRLAIR